MTKPTARPNGPTATPPAASPAASTYQPPAPVRDARGYVAPSYRPVFVTSLELASDKGAPAVWRTVADWLRRMRREAVEAELLVRSGSHGLASGATLEVLYTDSASPYLHAVRYAHPDAQVPGRRWITEVGLRAEIGAPTMRVSILLATDDVAAGALPELKPTRPALVWQLMHANAPGPATPGLRVDALGRAGAEAFRARVRDSARPYPIVVVSATPGGQYLVDAEKLRRQVVGLADVVRIEAGEDTRALAEAVGGEAVPWSGGVRLVFPVPAGAYAAPAPVRRVSPEEIDDWRIAGTTAEEELFTILARRTARANLARHLTLEQVREESIRRAVARHRRGDTAQLTELRSDVSDLWELLTAREQQMAALKQELDQREVQIEILEDEARRREHDVEALRVQLARASERPAEGAGMDDAGRAAVLAVIGGDFSLPDALRTVETLYAKRLIVLDSAWRSAEKSRQFQHVDKALDLLTKLAGPYWEALAAGGAGDAQARAVFGNAFAATESERVSNNSEGRKRRMFSYRGEKVALLAHLKIGVKDSVAQTLRIHFCWDPDARVIVVGHCGKHLDFD